MVKVKFVEVSLEFATVGGHTNDKAKTANTKHYKGILPLPQICCSSLLLGTTGKECGGNKLLWQFRPFENPLFAVLKIANQFR